MNCNGRIGYSACMKTAPVTYSGHQSGFGLMPSFNLWTLTEDWAGHPKGTTLSENTITKLGYSLPNDSREVQLVRQARKDSFNPWGR